MGTGTHSHQDNGDGGHSARLQATLVVIKPDAIQKRMTGAVMSRLDELGLTIVGAKVMRVSRALAEEHYKHLRQKPFFEELIQHICGQLHGVDAVLVFIYYGPDAIAKVRDLSGATNPELATPTSIRGAMGRLTTKGIFENVLHASSDEQEAEREIKLWFRAEELLVPLIAGRDSADAPKGASRK